VVTYGVLAGRTTTIDLATLYGKGIRILGTSGGTTPPADADAALECSLAAVLEGRVVVDHELLDLVDGDRAFARLRARDVSGKLLLRM
jgi:NADPH:quinone reductase-like Zn-dependent oxidoreductase